MIFLFLNFRQKLSVNSLPPLWYKLCEAPIYVKVSIDAKIRVLTSKILLMMNLWSLLWRKSPAVVWRNFDRCSEVSRLLLFDEPLIVVLKKIACCCLTNLWMLFPLRHRVFFIIPAKLKFEYANALLVKCMYAWLSKCNSILMQWLRAVNPSEVAQNP